MSAKTTDSPENSPDPSAESAPRARRISTPRPKKAAKKSAAVKSAPADTLDEVASIPFPSAPKREAPVELPPAAADDWPESEPDSMGSSPSQATESTKRKRRRRKGKGQTNAVQIAAEPVSEDTQSLPLPESNPVDFVQEQRPRPQVQQSPRPKIDPEQLTKMAWKIYLAEVSEEGVALIGDNDAKDLSRRCFRLAEIFIEEQTRRR